MVLKRKRGDEWVEVTQPRSTKTNTTTPASTLTKSQPKGGPSQPSTSFQPTGYGSGASVTPQTLYKAPVPVQKPVTPPSKKPRMAASSHPMFEAIKAQGIPPIMVPPSSHTTSTIVASSAYAASQPSTSAAAAAAAPKKAGRGRKKADASGEEGSALPEKRLARFKPSCPNNITERLERVREQRFFLLDRTGRPADTSPTSNCLSEEFKVSGSTGNVYTVTIDRLPRCSCPDSRKGNHCKHILFVFTKVLQVPRSSGHWYQKALLSTELSDVFSNAPQAPNAPTNPRMQAEYNRLTGKNTGPATASQFRRKMPEEGDDCPVCYDSMHGEAEKNLVWCEDCGNALHQACFKQWSTTARSQGKDVTCVWCRSKWIVAAASGSASGGVARTTSRGYLNLGGVGGVSPVRDTSSYYQGPRRGQRYLGSQYYGDD